MKIQMLHLFAARSGLIRFFWLSLVVGFTCRAAQSPNIVLIVSDDMGYSDLGCYGGEIRTPNLDSLAERGVRFTNYYVNNMCWPTRASLLTGLYPRTALQNKGASRGIRDEVATLPEILRRQGYATMMSGKWHLSDPDRPDGPDAPQNRGFDQFYGTIYGASDFFAPADLSLNGKPMLHEWQDNPDYYYTDAITDHALGFLNDHHAARSQDAPFFLYLAFNAAHWPLHAKPKDIAAYKGHFNKGWDQLRRERFARMRAMGIIDQRWKLSERHPKVPAWSDETNREWQERRMEVYAAQVTSMDENIGRVIDYLKKRGILEETIVIFQHDNGGCHVEYVPDRTGSWTRAFTTDGLKTPIKPGNIPGIMPGPQSTFQSYGHGWANLSNTPFRLFKQHDHEGGTRSPLIVSWPKGIPGDHQGTIVNSLCHAIDMMPTLLSLAGVETIQQSPLSFEGQSIVSNILRKEESVAPDREICWEHSKGRAIRSGKWKLVAVGKEPWELYDIEADGTELSDLARAQPELVARLSNRFEEWRKRTVLHR